METLLLNRDRGFTLIELMVVIAIVGLLASTVLASLSGARGTARDSARVSAMKEIQKSLELWRNANSSLYPCAVAAGSSPNNFTDLVINMTSANACSNLSAYLPLLPTDPVSPNGVNGYGYKPNTARSGYTLRMKRETNNPTAAYCKVLVGGGSGDATWDAYTNCF